MSVILSCKQELETHIKDDDSHALKCDVIPPSCLLIMQHGSLSSLCVSDFAQFQGICQTHPFSVFTRTSQCWNIVESRRTWKISALELYASFPYHNVPSLCGLIWYHSLCQPALGPISLPLPVTSSSYRLEGSAHKHCVFRLLHSACDWLIQCIVVKLIYRIMPYTSTGHEGITPRRSLFKSQEESLNISNIFDAVIMYDLYGHDRLQ